MKKYAFIFPGQGSQAMGMGEDFYRSFSIAKEHFEQASDILKIDMRKLLFEENEKLNQTQWTQPAIFLVSYIAHKIFQSEFPLIPTFGMGHSLGEISAVSTGEGLSFENAIKLTHLRGKLMTQACEGKDAGMMVVVGLEDEKMESYAKQARDQGKEIWCANYNGDGQIVLAGKKADLDSSTEEIKSLGAKRSMLLPMSVASHCPLLESICEEFSSLLNDLLENSLIAPVISNATIKAYSSKEEAIRQLTQQLTSPVFYKQSIRQIDESVSGYIEFGHGNILKGLNKRLSSKPTLSICDSQSLKESIEFLSQGE